MPSESEGTTPSPTPAPTSPTATASNAAPAKAGAPSFDASKLRARRNETEIPRAAKVSFALGLGTLAMIFLILIVQAYLRHREFEDIEEQKRQAEAAANAPRPPAPEAAPKAKVYDNLGGGGGGGGGFVGADGGGKIEDQNDGIPMPSAHYAVLHSLKSLLYDAGHDAKRAMSDDPTLTFPPGAFDGCPPESLNNLQDARLNAAHFNIALLRILGSTTAGTSVAYKLEAQATAPDGSNVVSRGEIEIADGSDQQAVIQRFQSMTPFDEPAAMPPPGDGKPPAEGSTQPSFRGLPPPTGFVKATSAGPSQAGYPFDIR
jgi:hypothetical protein